MRKHYTSDLSDEQWALVDPLIPPQRTGGDRRTADMREVVEAILYVTKNGCQWRDIPGDFAPDWHTVYAYFNQWSHDGTWQRIYEALHRSWRKGQGRGETPSAAITDSQSVRTTEGFPVSVVVTAASTGEREGAKALLRKAKAWLPRLRLLWVDAGYGGEPFAAWALEEGGWTVEVVHKQQEGFSVLMRRWVVERTFAWLYKCRRLCRDFEHLTESVTGFIYIAVMRLLVRRLAPPPTTS